jgi:signal transduction histidine kinase
MSMHAVKTMIFAVLLLVAGNAVAQQFGTPQEAKAMLEKAVAALQADKAAALKSFTAGTPPFKDKDLYVFCFDTTGLYTAHGARPERIGKVNVADAPDANGKYYGKEMLSVAKEGAFNTVEYAFPRPGETQAVPKVSYITKVSDQICGVGYYK